MLHSINYCMCVFLKFICIYFFLYYRGPCVRKLFTGLPSQNKEHCIVLYCIVLLKAGCVKYFLFPYSFLQFITCKFFSCENKVVAVVLKVGEPKKECKNNISQNYIPRLVTYFCPNEYTSAP